jgi:hypothetical protein
MLSVASRHCDGQRVTRVHFARCSPFAYLVYTLSCCYVIMLHVEQQHKQPEPSKPSRLSLQPRRTTCASAYGAYGRAEQLITFPVDIRIAVSIMADLWVLPVALEPASAVSTSCPKQRLRGSAKSSTASMQPPNHDVTAFPYFFCVRACFPAPKRSINSPLTSVLSCRVPCRAWRALA